MRWKLHKTSDKTNWKLWFAWYPITVEGKTVWAEWVWTRKELCYSWDGFDWAYYYTLLNPSDDTARPNLTPHTPHDTPNP